MAQILDFLLEAGDLALIELVQEEILKK